MQDNYDYIYKLRICNIYCFSTGRTLRDYAWIFLVYVHCVPLNVMAQLRSASVMHKNMLNSRISGDIKGVAETPDIFGPHIIMKCVSSPAPPSINLLNRYTRIATELTVVLYVVCVLACHIIFHYCLWLHVYLWIWKSNIKIRPLYPQASAAILTIKRLGGSQWMGM